MLRPEMDLQSPETFPENRARLEREVRDALAYGGLQIAPQVLVNELIDLVIGERMEVRETIANRIIGPIIGRYDSVNDTQLELLAMLVEFYVEDENGTIDFAFDPTETKR